MKVAFLGLGHMGEPMAGNLLRTGQALTVWNRSPSAAARLAAQGATVAPSAAEALRGADAAILMLANAEAIDAVLERGTRQFRAFVSGRLIIHMGTTAPAYSAALEADIRAASGRFVEAPVSGSRRPAEDGALVGMLAGKDDAVADALPLVAPMCSQTFNCGAVPSALQMKLAVNLYLVTLLAGLSEAANFAAGLGLDLQLFRTILDAGPMASGVSRGKLEKIVHGDFSVQAAVDAVHLNSRLIADDARAAGIATPLLLASERLLAAACAQGLGQEDVAAVVKTLAAARTVA